MLEIFNLSKHFTDKKLFSDVNLRFNTGNTYGIIGANGVGKSTLLKIIAGEVEPTSGSIILNPQDARISFLRQDQAMFDNYEVTNTVIAGNKTLAQIQIRKDEIYANPNATNKEYEEAAMLEEKFGLLGGWNAENDAQILLAGLGVDATKWHHQMRDLKSMEKIKVLLAQALFGNPDVLILDEPTNHLDLKAIKWLEEFLIAYEKIVIIVSHDSDFLDAVCTHIVDIDFGGAKMFTGNYSFWKESSQLALELTQKSNAKAEERKKKLEEFIARFSANASKSAQATSRKKSLEKIKIEEITPSNRKYPFISFALNRDPGKDVLKVNDLSYKTPAGELLFSNVSFSLYRDEKMAVVGGDDITKTRFLEILMKIVQPTGGEVVWGPTITPDFFPSNNDAFFNTNENILDWISKYPADNKEEVNRDNSDQRMRSFLGRMLFSGDAVFKLARVSSGGERARLMFSRMMLRESNFLIFDQPLDHLDTESIDAVIEGVKTYKSSCIFSTYNRAMIRDVANVILELSPNGGKIFRGTLAEYEGKVR